MLRVLVLLVALAGQAGAAPLVLDERVPDRVELGAAAVSVLRDPTAALDAADVRRRTREFRPLEPGRAPNFGYTGDAIWLRIELRSALAVASDWRLELDYASLDHAELHDADGTVQRVGDRLPLLLRAIPHRNPVFAIRLAPGETRELLLRIRSEGSVTSNPSLWRAGAFVAHSENSYAANAMYFGTLAALALYNLLLWVAIRERVFLYYVLFVAGMGTGIACVYGFAGQFLWPANVEVANRALVVGFALSGIVGPLFTQDFLGTARRAPHWHMALAFSAWLHAAVLVLGLFGPLSIGMRVISAATLLNCGLMFFGGFVAAARRVPGARLFVLAFAVLMFFGLVMALRNFGLLPTNVVTLHGIQIGHALEMLLLSFALAERFNQMKLEKAHAQAEALAAQQQLVESLQQQERVLAQRVAERTDELAAANARLRELALHDPLTGLANRAALYAHVDDALARVHADGGTLCLLMIDLDGFKAVNDHHGHDAGDRVLIEVAERLKRVARPQDVVARLGGDEFVIVAEGLALPEDALQVAQAIVAAVRVPMVAAPDSPVGASVGIASNRAVVSETEALLRRADTAMYAAKAAGRGKVHWWPEEGVEPARSEAARTSAG